MVVFGFCQLLKNIFFAIVMVPPWCILNGGTVPPRCILNGGTVPPWCILDGGTVPPWCILNGGTVPPFNLFLFKNNYPYLILLKCNFICCFYMLVCVLLLRSCGTSFCRTFLYCACFSPIQKQTHMFKEC